MRWGKTMKIETIQQGLWYGEFGNAYHKRNYQTDRQQQWMRIIGLYMPEIKSVFEPGAGQGDNLCAIRNIAREMKTPCRFTGMDVNAYAHKLMAERELVAIHGAFPGTPIDNRYDLVITRGFLIHLPAEDLYHALDKIYSMSNRFICVSEYYSPSRRRVSYRGQRSAMWTGDYAGLLMGKYKGLRLLDYGFNYHLDGGDDETWFLLEKTNA